MCEKINTIEYIVNILSVDGMDAHGRVYVWSLLILFCVVDVEMISKEIESRER